MPCIRPCFSFCSSDTKTSTEVKGLEVKDDFGAVMSVKGLEVKDDFGAVMSIASTNQQKAMAIASGNFSGHDSLYKLDYY